MDETFLTLGYRLTSRCSKDCDCQRSLGRILDVNLRQLEVTYERTPTNCDTKWSIEGHWLEIATTGSHLENHWVTICNRKSSLAALLGDNF